MPNKCSFCTVIKPTNHLLIPTPNGINWIEFCERCGNKETLERWTNDELEIKSIKEIYDEAAQDRINKERTDS